LVFGHEILDETEVMWRTDRKNENWGRRTLEDISHLTEGLIFATGENLNSCLKITNLRDKDKRIVRLDTGEEERSITRCCLRKRNSRCAILFWSRRAACELGSVECQTMHVSMLTAGLLGVFLPPRFTRRSIIAVMKLLW